MKRCRTNLPNRCCHLISRVARRAFEGGQAADRKGRAAMTRKSYCGNLLWQSSLTLMVPEVKGPKGSFRVKAVLSDREKHLLLCGGLLASL